MPSAERALLHRGGRTGTWGSLGLWHDGADDYAEACSSLARAVGEAAGLRRGDRVLSLACGAGDELLLWAQDFGAAEVVGLELDPVHAAAATRQAGSASLPRGTRIEVRRADVRQLARAGLPRGYFDRIVCVDAAYWLGPRAALWRAAATLLRPGGRIAFTDLSLAPERLAGRPLLRALLHGAAGLARVPLGELRPAAAQAEALAGAGYGGVQWLQLDATVLDGFAAHVRRQGPRVSRTGLHPDWRRPALTAKLIGPCRAAGLGYVLVSGEWRGEPSPGRAAATAAADRTALSSRGTPVSA